MKKNKVTLSFDIEEFDTPLESGCNLSFSEQVRISVEGSHRILDLMKKHAVHATFFCTVNFLEHAPEIAERILKEGHEPASHGYYHSTFDVADLKRSREELEKIFGRKIAGYRMPRMMPIENQDLVDAGYTYNASLHPTFIPGRYNNFNKPRLIFRTGDLLQIPASVTPILRIPLFWLSLHNFPLGIYKSLLRRTLKHDGTINMYFHPWEFADIQDPSLKLSSIITRNSGIKMSERLESVILELKSAHTEFVTFESLIESLRQSRTEIPAE